MKKTTISLFTLVIIAAIFLAPLFYWIILGKTDKGLSEIENRILSTFPTDVFLNFRTAIKRIFQKLPKESGELFFNGVIVGDLQKEYESAMKDQFPARDMLLNISAFWEQINIRTAYSLTEDELIPASFSKDYLVTRDYQYIVEKPANWSVENERNLDSLLNQFGEMKKSLPLLNFTLFIIEPIQNSAAHPSINSYPNADGGKTATYIEKNQPPSWQMDALILNSFAEYRNLYHKTDHHLNIHGGWEMYKRIYQILSHSYNEISPMLELVEIKTIPGLKMLGSKASRTLIDKNPEVFEYAVVDLPEYQINVNYELTEYGARKEYSSGEFSSKKYANHYGRFYGTVRKIIRYSFPSSPERNLLVFTDSYFRLIQNYIASHYRDTVVIDIRFINDLDKGISEIVEEYDIDDILIVSSVDILTNEFPVLDF